MQTLISINPVKWLISCLSFRPIANPPNTLIVLLDLASEAGVLENAIPTLIEIKTRKIESKLRVKARERQQCPYESRERNKFETQP